MKAELDIKPFLKAIDEDSSGEVTGGLVTYSAKTSTGFYVTAPAADN